MLKRFLKYVFVWFFGCVESKLQLTGYFCVEHRLFVTACRFFSSWGMWASLPHSMWDPPGPGIELLSPAMEGRFLTTGPLKSLKGLFLTVGASLLNVHGESLRRSCDRQYFQAFGPFYFLEHFEKSWGLQYTLSGTLHLTLLRKKYESSRSQIEVKVLVAQLCLTLYGPMDCSPPGSSVHGILQARTLEWVVVPFPRGSSRPRDQTLVSHTAGRFFTAWATREAPKGETWFSQ